MLIVKKVFVRIALGIIVNCIPVSAQSLQSLYPSHSAFDQIVVHSAYVLAYSESHEQPSWVFYRLSHDQLNGSAKRTDNFRVDPDVITASASLQDYASSGYDRGHLAPAADFSWSETAMSESFFMSNMSPQTPGFNRGIWKRLEDQVRTWAAENEEIYIVVGPILEKGLPKIGSNGVSVPRYYFKVIIDLKEPDVKGIGFLMPHESSGEPLQKFAVRIDSVENLTGLDFFSGLEDPVENYVEATIAGTWFGETIASSTSTSPVTAAVPIFYTEKIEQLKQNEANALYVGSINSDKFHRKDCRYASQIKQYNLKTWKTSEEALKEGRVPCKLCNLIESVSNVSKEQPKQKPADDVMIYVAKSGTKYHRAGCRHLKSSIPMKLSDAKKRYSPCSVCSPPR